MEKLGHFCHFSGHKVNAGKSKIYFSTNTKKLVKGMISEQLGFQGVDDLKNYLRVPLFHHRLKKRTFQFVIDKENIVSSWGNKESIDLLNDTWILELGPLRNYMMGNAITISSIKVAKMVMNNGQWNWSRLFNREVLDFISVCHPSTEVLGNDRCFWKLNSFGKFSIKSVYLKMDGEPKLLTNHEQMRRNLVANGDCALCGCGDETVLHVLHNCSFAKKLWRMSMTKDDVMNGRKEEDIKWRSLSHGWVKINPDWSTSMIDNWSIVGGVIRDSLGNWKEGFKKHLGRCSILNTELWATFCGLEVPKLREYRKFIVESDCLEVVECLTNKSGESYLWSGRFLRLRGAFKW
ncbi:hypothetical protein Gogos_010197 [Gossypium gossypioides]|uniref:Reverse transcriptase zinc-binding domain-containing protein n=1 Tax=Gossypium gossypioides TaxID=34282 RepID=A0A7J9BKI5_GOSGO|nr:hypothetical protein [Gossypium gossypioides]